MFTDTFKKLKYERGQTFCKAEGHDIKRRYFGIFVHLF